MKTPAQIDPAQPVRPTIEWLSERLRDQLTQAVIATREGRSSTACLENARAAADLLIDRIDRLSGAMRFQCLAPACRRNAGYFCAEHTSAEDGTVDLVLKLNDMPGVSLPGARAAIGIVTNFPHLEQQVDLVELARTVDVAIGRG